MNRFSTLSAVIALSAAALVAQPFAAQAAGLRPVIGIGMRTPVIGTVRPPVIDPLPTNHGIVVDPIQRVPVLGNGNSNPVPPIKRAPVIGNGSDGKPVLGTATHVIPVDPFPLPHFPTFGTGHKKTPPVAITPEKP